jgi:SAM-dependent methyltransferase
VRSPLARLLLVSFVSLFLELLMIRWISTEIRIFAHLKNLALIACFAGLGLGYGLRRKQFSPLLSYWGMAILVVLALPPSVLGQWSLKNLNRWIVFKDLYSWTPANDIATMAMAVCVLLAIFLDIVFMFIPLGQMLGRIFRESPNPLRDYTWNVAASLVGILAFTGLSVLGTPPWVWFLCAFIPMLALLPRRHLTQIGALVPLLLMLGAPLLDVPSPAIISVQWSPYQKIQMWRLQARPAGPGRWTLAADIEKDQGPVMYMLDVNDTAMMWLLDLSPRELGRYPWVEAPGKIEWYDFPYHIYDAPRRVLVIGAGGGNDTAAALRHGAGHVDAVEIDPFIAALGRKYHPEHPYDDPRVTVHVNDARRFLAATHEKYDLIVFAQLDNTDYNSMSNLSNIRMDSYIYTRQSIAAAYRLLAPDGVMVVNFGADENQGRRTVRMIADAIGTVPRSFKNDLQMLFKGVQDTYVIDPSHRLDRALASDRALAAWVAQREMRWTPSYDTPDVSDDWPYWFLPRKAVPSLQIMVMIFIVAVSAALIMILLPGRSRAIDLHFFFLGAAFMLLEVHSISRVALLLGATWLPNAAVISVVLLMIILGNLVVARLRPAWKVSYALLGVSLLVQLIPQTLYIDPASNASVALALIVYALPIFFAALIFGRSFDACAAPDDALRSNLLGAICGGLLESLSFILGMSALMYVIIALYGLSALFAPSGAVRASGVDASPPPESLSAG